MTLPWFDHNIIVKSCLSDNRNPFQLQPKPIFPMDEAGDRSRPFNGMNIDDVLQGFNIDSEDHDGITDPLNTSADITGGTFDDDVSFGWFLRDPPSTPGPDDSVDDSVSQDTQEEEEHVPGPNPEINLPCPRFTNGANRCW